MLGLNENFAKRPEQFISNLKKGKGNYVIFGLVSILVFLTVFYLGPFEGFGLLGKRKAGQTSLAASTAAAEAESGTLTGNVTVGTDSNASGGKYIQFGTVPAPNPSPAASPVGSPVASPFPSPLPTPPSSAGFQPSPPYYATFFYPWYKNPKTDGSWSDWEDNGHTPAQNWFSNYLPDPNPSVFDPANELYSSNNDSIIYWQLRKLAEAK